MLLRPLAPGPIIALASLVFTAGAILLIFLVLLAGAVDGSPVNQIYFLQADTSAVKGAPATSQWTFWNVCDGSSGVDANCGQVYAANTFDPPGNFGTNDGLPADFVGYAVWSRVMQITSRLTGDSTHKFYYLSRFFFAFTLIGLFFAVVSLLTGLAAACFRIGGVFSGLLVSFALFWQLAGASLMT